MEVVEEFKQEIHSLYECRLPVSRAKMATITKLAMKGAKFYKHIVMIVEKFINKSAAPYKLPALYTIDSIVRQSKHQFTGPKEVYGPRFAKNFEKTFTYIFQCPDSDKPKVFRVLNLWQKNNVYSSEILQPLLELAPKTGSPQEQPSSTQLVSDDKKEMELSSLTHQEQIDSLLQQQQDQLQHLLTQSVTSGQTDVLAALLDKAKQLKQLQNLQQEITGNNPQPVLSEDPLALGPPVSTDPITHKTSRQSVVANEFSKALLDNFDYSSEEEGDGDITGGNPAIEKTESLPPLEQSSATDIIDQLEEQFKKEKGLSETSHLTNIPLPPAPPTLPPPLIMQSGFPPMVPPPIMPLPPQVAPPTSQDWIPSRLPPPPPTSQSLSPHGWRDNRGWSSYAPPPPPPPNYRSRSPMSSFPSRSPPPNFHSRSPRYHHRSPRDSFRERYRDRSPHHYERGRDRWSHDDRGRRMSPPYRERKPPSLNKPNHVTVYSTTVWVGHLNKNMTDEQLKEIMVQFGPVKSVDCIIARGCAYVVMEKRDDAVKAVDRLKDMKILGQKCKVAWAPGRGVKGKTYQSYWDIKPGLSCIPWELIKTEAELVTLGEGGWVDPSSLPPELATKSSDDMAIANSPDH